MIFNFGIKLAIGDVQCFREMDSLVRRLRWWRNEDKKYPKE